MKKLLLICFVISVTSSQVLAQFETTLPFMRGMYQSSIINPGFMPQYKVNVGLPVINNLGLNIGINGLDAQMLINNTNSEGELDLNNLSDAIQGNAVGFRFNYPFDVIYLSFPIAGFYIGVGSTVKMNFNADLSKDLITGSIFVKGKTVDFSGTNISAMLLSEHHASIAKQFGKFSAGARIKYVVGHAYMGVENLKMTTYTSPDIPYPVTLTASGSIVTAGIPILMDSLNGKKFGKEDTEFDVNDITGKNHGFGFDFGGTYQVNEKLEVFASIIDIGQINWQHKTYRYSLNNVKQTYAGLDYVKVNNNELRTLYLDSLLDNILTKADASKEGFERALPTRHFLGASYALTKNDKVGFLYQGQYINQNLLTAYTFNYTHMFGRFWQVTGNYTLFEGANSSIGVGTTFKLGPFQLYYIQDNIMAYIKPATARVVYFRFGLNLVFGDLNKVKKDRPNLRMTPDED